MLKNQYVKKVTELLDKVNKDPVIDEAAHLMVEAIINKNLLYSFGASHAGILTQEMFYRAGGLALINPIFDKNLMLDIVPVTKTSEMENLADFGNIIASNVGFKSGDVLIAHSVSGRNSVIIDLVNYAKEQGVRVIVITNLAYSKSVTSRHKSGKCLYELADIVIDNYGDIGDSCIPFPNSKYKLAPTSTVIGSAIVNMLLLSVVQNLPEDSYSTLPIFASSNMDDTVDHNKNVLTEYKAQIRYQ